EFISKYTAIFKVKNGKWDDGTTADKMVTINSSDHKIGNNIPSVGNMPNTGYKKSGSWDPTLTTGTTINDVTTYTYTYEAKGSQTIQANNVSATYGDTDKSVSANVTSPLTGGGAISYAVKSGSETYINVDSSSGALTIKQVPPSGKAYVTVTAAETDNYNKATKEVTVTIAKATPTVTAPNANDLTYNAQPQTLVTQGSTTAGTLLYSLDGVNYSASVPTATNAGTYTVYYKVQGNSNYSDLAAQTVQVTIAVAQIGSTKYGTFAEAVAAANNGEKTIQILASNVGTYQLSSPSEKVKITSDSWKKVTFKAPDGPYVMNWDTTTAAPDYIAVVGNALYEITDKDGNVTYDKLFPAAKTITKVKLLDDVSESMVSVTSTEPSFTLDLNGHTFTTTTTKDSSVSLKAGTASARKTFVLTDSSAAKSGKLVSSAKQAAIWLTSSSSKYIDIVIEAGIETTGNTYGIGIDKYPKYNTVTVKDGANITGLSGIYTNGNSADNEIIVEGGEITATEIGILNCGDNDLTITGGEITGKTAVYVKSGTLEVTGGTLTGTGSADYEYNGNGANATGNALVIDSCGYPGGAPEVTVNGGTFIGTQKDAVGSYAYGTGNEEVEQFVYAGTFSNEVPEEQAAPGFVPSPVDPVTGMYTVEVDNSSPLNPLNVAAKAINDNNAFGLTDVDYLMGTLLGVQAKSTAGEGTSSQEGTYNMRFVACLDTDILKSADDYGFVVAKLDGTKDYSNTKIENLKAFWGNGEKTASAKGTYNNVCGTPAYGDPTDDSTPYKYITCAINNVSDGDKFVARFYVKIDGKYYYAKYSGHNYKYTGCIASWSDVFE
ncbi:MAG: hypothetical protein K6F88_06315, partial [Ruminococcus sp.]|nr:hypothetical protein [Ruminococcus sp.]